MRKILLVALSVLFIILLFVDCNFITSTKKEVKEEPIILSLKSQTEWLYKNLKQLSDSGKMMFGMANPTTIGYLNKQNNEINQSDAKDIAGSHPAFHESDFMWYEENPEFMVYDLKAMKEAYKRGAVCGYCWHFRGKESGEFYAKKDGEFTADKDLVKEIIRSSSRKNNEALNWYLNRIDSLLIPVFRELNFPLLFRPFHEMNGNWFWWGSDNCTPQQYQRLFQITVNYLREKKIENLIYVWSVNIDDEVKWEYYPGDEYVDVLGLDCYEPGIAEWAPTEKYIQHLQELTDYAEKTGKIAALTETGCRKSDDGDFTYPDLYPDFWTKYVLEPVLNHPKASRIVWFMSWYGADWHNDRQYQFYIPYKGMTRPNSGKAIDDFREMRKMKQVLFEDDLPNMY